MLRGVVVGQEGCKSKVVVVLAPGLVFSLKNLFKSGWRGFEAALIESRRKCFLFQLPKIFVFFIFLSISALLLLGARIHFAPPA